MTNPMTTNNIDAYQSLVQHLTQLTDSHEIEAILAALLTDKELQEIANRVRIFDLLQQGVTQRAISQQLGVGIATVSRGAKALQRHEGNTIDKLLTLHRNRKE